MADLIISIDDLKTVCGISDAFDANYLEPMIVQSIDLATQSVLGTALTVKLRTDYNNGGIGGIYATLWNSDESSVKKMICWQTYQLSLPRMLYKIGAETISSGDTDEVTSITQDELGLLIRQADSTRVQYENRVKEFLTNNYSSIPELATSTLGYLRPNTEEVNTSMGLSFGTNNTFTDF
jgi:hypothetical protein